LPWHVPNFSGDKNKCEILIYLWLPVSLDFLPLLRDEKFGHAGSQTIFEIYFHARPSKLVKSRVMCMRVWIRTRLVCEWILRWAVPEINRLKQLSRRRHKEKSPSSQHKHEFAPRALAFLELTSCFLRSSEKRRVLPISSS